MTKKKRGTKKPAGLKRDDASKETLLESNVPVKATKQPRFYKTTNASLSPSKTSEMKWNVPHGYTLVFRVCRLMELYKLRKKGFLSSSKPKKKDFCIKKLEKHILQSGEIRFYSNVLSVSTNLDWMLYYFCKSVTTNEDGDARILTLLLVKESDLLDPLMMFPSSSSAFKSCFLANEKVAIGTLPVYKFWTFSLCAEPTFMVRVPGLFYGMYGQRLDPPYPYETWNGSLKLPAKWKNTLCKKKRWHLWTPKPYKKSKFTMSVLHLPRRSWVVNTDGIQALEALEALPKASVFPKASVLPKDDGKIETLSSSDDESSLFSTTESYDLMDSEDELEEKLLKLKL